MKQVDDAMMVRVEKADLMRQLTQHEREAAKIRSKLGLVQRDAVETVTQEAAIKRDNVVRMRSDQLTKLYEQKKITDAQAQAGFKFREVWEAIGRGLYPGNADRLSSTGGRSSYRHPLEKMNDYEFFVWFYEYRPWANGPAAKPAINKDNFQLSYLRVCYAIIIDGYGPSQLERMWPVTRGNGVIMALFKQGLSMWKHLDYAADDKLEGIRRQLIDEARKKMEKYEPAGNKKSSRQSRLDTYAELSA